MRSSGIPGFPPELLHARTIVDALLRQLDAAHTVLPPESEDSHAAAKLSRPTTSARRTRMGALDKEQRAHLVLRLARLIARAIATAGDHHDERTEQDHR